MASIRRLVALGAALALTLSAATAFADSGLPLWQRVILGGEYTGFKPQPFPPKQFNLSGFVNETSGFFTRITKASLSREMRRDGFRAALLEQLSGSAGHDATSAVLLFSSPAGAKRAMEFFYNDSLRPCPHTCTVSAFEFSVEKIPGAKGSYRARYTADGPKPAQQRFELDSVDYTEGPYLYSLISNGKPDEVDRGALIDAAKRQYERVK